ncbi:Dihydrofolate reductase [Marinilactibacillus piezotolerans]|uniref:Dihydrofolate reductase n=1 Tax=Marinilactibacillus piezotolerans TaxID=258723 RepID=A0A1I4BL36_9LACT|nr:dihydrofolate reductase family protein [Marinilactibacillus piezotolerans]SFK69060.1 Dihydrofolate reductase [Marinilactibacillus piezotolerans]
MKRKVVLFIAMSLDGYIARKNGAIDWLDTSIDHPVEDFSYENFYSTIDTVIMGRTTYDQVINELSPDLYPYKDIQSYVLTSRPAQPKKHVKFITEDISELILRLKREAGKDIWIVGGHSIIKPLLQLNMINEFKITIIPTLLGNGIPLFDSFQNEIKLQQVNSYVRNQLTYLHFVRK